MNTILNKVSVYVGTYKKYNEGNIFGEWLTLGDYIDYEEFIKACKDLHEDEEYPELMFQDWECPDELRGFISEMSIDENLFLLNDVEEDEHVKTEEGKNIEGAIIIKWEWHRYVGLSRNFLDVGIAGQYPYHNILKEIDLITGYEDRVFRTNYSILATKEELEEYGTDVLLRNMIEGDWRWNNVQDVSNIMNHFVKSNLKGYVDRAMFNRIYQGYHLGKMVDEEGSITHEGFECEWKSRVRIREEYREDLGRLIEKGILPEDIVEDMLELDYQKVMEVLSKVKENYER